MIEINSPYDFDVTVEKIKDYLDEKKLMQPIVFDHGQNATKVGLKLRRIKVFVFGNPNVGTHLMIDVPQISIELPLKISVIENDDKSASVFYKEPIDFVKQYKLSEKSLETINKMSNVLKAATNFDK